MTDKRRMVLVLMGLLLLAAAGLRFHQLGAQSLWNDEGNSYVQATRSLSAIADNAGRDIHPPGYYWLLSIWMRFTGESEFALRALSALASVASVALTFALGKRLYGVFPGLIAAGMVAFNTFSIFYAQEARMYALLALWSVASMWAFVGLLRNPHARGWLIALAVFNMAGLYTQYAFPFVMLAQGVLFLIWLPLIPRSDVRRTLIAYVTANVITVLLFAPWLPTAWEQITTWPSTGAPVEFNQAIADLLAYFGFGLTVGTGTSIAVAFFLLFALIQLPSERGTGRWWAVIVPLVWIVVSVGIFLAQDLFREANLKFLLPAQIAFALWVGRGVWVLWRIEPREDTWQVRLIPKAAAIVGGVSVLVTLISGVPPLYNDVAYQRDNYRAIVQSISADARNGDVILLNGPGQQEVFNYYYDGETPMIPIPRGYGGDDAATLAETQTVIADYERIFAVLWGTEERDPNGVVENTLDTDAYEAISEWYGDVRLVRYVTPDTFDTVESVSVAFGESIELEGYALNGETFAPGDVVQLQLRWRTDSPLTTRYKVFVQLLNPDGTLAVQRDAEPGGGLLPTVDWTPDETVIDNHALILPQHLPPAHYVLIIGLYNSNDPLARLPVVETDYFVVSHIEIESN